MIKKPAKFQDLLSGDDIAVADFGARARRLMKLAREGLPVPQAFALPVRAVRSRAAGQALDCAVILPAFGENPVLSVRSSPQNPDWGGPETILNVGMTEATRTALVPALGEGPARALYARFVQAYAIRVARLDADMFDMLDEAVPGEDALQAALRAYEEEMEEPFPQDVAVQLENVLRSMARAWEGTSARLLRQAKGAPADMAVELVNDGPITLSIET